jgi:hypothetical protein
MDFPRRLKLASGALTWTATLPQRPWTPARQVLGGSDESWAGVPESWVDREDSILALRPVCREGEWPALRAVVVYAQRNAAVLTVWPDASDAGTSFETYLITPKFGDEITPTPAETLGFYELSLKVRTVDGSAIEPEYFG